MLGKLLKYDLKYVFRTMWLIWVAVIVLGLISAVTGRGDYAFFESNYSAIPLILYGCMWVAMGVLACLILIQRFYNGLLKEEGYLMFTLPARPWQLVTAKSISAVILLLLSCIVGGISITLMMLVLMAGPGTERMDAFTCVFHMIGSVPNWLLLAIEALIIVIGAFGKTIYQIYTSMALGHLAKKHRIAMSIVAYMGITIVLSFIGLSGLCGDLDFLNIDAFEEIVIDGATVSIPSQLAIWWVIALEAVQIAVFHWATVFILKHKLNLE